MIDEKFLYSKSVFFFSECRVNTVQDYLFQTTDQTVEIIISDALPGDKRKPHKEKKLINMTNTSRSENEQTNQSTVIWLSVLIQMNR